MYSIPQIPTCWQLAKVRVAYGVVADFTLALFPISIVWNLKVDMKTKFGLVSLMCLGVLYVCVSSEPMIYTD